MSRTSNILLRIALAFAFLYPPLDAIAHPDIWIEFFPQFLLSAFPNSSILLHVWGVGQAIIALWLLSGWRIFVPSVIAALMLVAIVVFNQSVFDIVFRDVALALVALALAWESRKVA